MHALSSLTKLAALEHMRRLYGDAIDDPEWRKMWRRQFPEAAAENLRPEWFGDAEPKSETPEPQRLSLMMLVAKYGGYPNIPPEAWAAYDAQMALPPSDAETES
jgi:hypothetical protein